ncbi:MAG TPA: HdeD family acid-resistance protein [Blastocatellia bacterium]
MFNLVTQNWWAIELRGFAAVLFGIATFMWPGVTLSVLAPLFGAYAMINGIFAVIEGFRSDVSQERWRPLLLEGAVSIVLGVMTFAWPGLTAMGLLFLIAFWAIMTGVFEIITAIRLRREIRGEWVMALIAILSMAFGLLLLAYPGPGALSVFLLIRAFVFAIGALMIALALKLRSLRRPGGEAPPVRHAAPSH